MGVHGRRGVHAVVAIRAVVQVRLVVQVDDRGHRTRYMYVMLMVWHATVCSGLLWYALGVANM